MPIRIGPDGSPGLVAGVFFFTGEIQSFDWRLKKIPTGKNRVNIFHNLLPPLTL